MQETNDLVKQRLLALEEIKKLGINPYPHRFDVTADSAGILSTFKDPADEAEAEEQKKKTVSVAGRIMAIRKMGKASFFQIKDESGKIQIYIRQNDVGEQLYKLFKLLDIGDIVGVNGFVFRTKMGEVSVHANSIELLAKTIQPLPVVKEEVTETGEKIIHDAFADVELRYRQRYIDLIVNEHVKDTFVKRTKIIHSIKRTLEKYNFFEVETPTLQSIYGGANARPFATHHNALDIPLYLRISNELYLKRLVVGGFNRVYELVKDFRNEGIDRTHNPEFSQIEWYQAYGDYNDSMNLFEEVVENACLAVHKTAKVDYQGTEIDFSRPWKRLKMVDAISEKCGIDVLDMKKADIIKYMNDKNIEFDPKLSHSKGLVIAALFEAACEEDLVQPTFVLDHPIDTTPLCKPLRRYSMQQLEEMRQDPEQVIFVERFEPYINKWELGNSYTELNDPVLQRKLLEEQVERGRGGEEETHPLDEDFLRAIEIGMPPTTGVGLGVDRLVMLLTNSQTIRDVLFFPLMRPL
ncbi:MAG: Class II lysyl-tRNA synthetase [Chlorobi bacterium OLB5]|nr:MAG: Class II lysyl-tRNA synthetase [Chlorobi bacterium OLB5]